MIAMILVLIFAAWALIMMWNGEDPVGRKVLGPLGLALASFIWMVWV